MTIVQDDKMAGEPRLEGHRITVLTVVTFVEDFGSISDAARELRISEADVREALGYARSHPAQMEDLREEWADLGREPLPGRDDGFTTPDMDEYLDVNQDADEL